MSKLRPSCFVLMPFGKKKDPARPGGRTIDFDRIYDEAIEPAIKKAGLDPVRADREDEGGFIHKPMLERLLLCEFAVADLTLPNPNVYYELGVRHSVRHNTTLLIFADHVKLPFDVAPFRALPYGLRDRQGLRTALVDQLKKLREMARTGDPTDSPVHQLAAGLSQSNQLPLDQRLRRIKDADGGLYEMLNVYARQQKTEVFRDVVAYNQEQKAKLARARARGAKGLADLDKIRKGLGTLERTEAGIIVDLFLSYRALGQWERMARLYEDMPAVLKGSVLLREQHALALNRLAAGTPAKPELRAEAARLLEGVTTEIGPNPETQGLLGRIHKDCWKDACARGATKEAEGHLKAAIAAYARGFEADWRDAFPGINAVTLLAVEGSRASLAKRDALLPLVRFAVEQKLARSPDYWDHAALLELALHAKDRKAAKRHLADALAIRDIESFMPKATADNLGYLAKALARRGQSVTWIKQVMSGLLKKHEELLRPVAVGSGRSSAGRGGRKARNQRRAK